MKYVYLLLILITAQSFLSAQTVVEKSGTIAISENWNYDTVKIVNNISIANGVTLTIQPGSVIEFQGHYSFEVQGTIQAKGEKSNRILFEAKDSVLTDDSGGWQGIRFDNTAISNDSSHFEYCDFLYGNAFGPGWFDQQGGVFAIKDFGKVVVKNSSLVKSKARGLNGIVYIRNSNPLIAGNLIANNIGTGIEISNNGNPLLVNNTIANNTGYGINRNTLTPVIRNCIIAFNDLSNLKEFTNQGNYISYCNIPESGFTTNGNITANPKFADEENRNYGLKNNSPCIDAGSPNVLSIDLQYDIIGNHRVFKGAIDTLIDIGAYELAEEPIPLFTITPDTLFFGDLLAGAIQSKKFKIVNEDPYPITVYSILSAETDVKLDVFENLVLNTGDSLEVELSFEPNTEKVYRTSIQIESNYRKGETDSVIILGSGLPAPTFEIVTEKIETTLDCTDSVTATLVLRNSGSGVLDYTIPLEFFDGFENGLANWVYTPNWDTVAESFDGSYALTESPLGNYASNMDAAITLKQNIPVFNSDACTLSYRLKTEMENCCDQFITEVQINNSEWLQQATINGIHDWTSKTIDLSGLVNSGDSLRVRFRFTSDLSNNFEGILLDNIEITGVGTENLELSKTSGAIQPGETDEINISFNAGNRAGDFHLSKFKVLSNDPLMLEDTVTCLFHLNRFSTLILVTDSLLFGNIEVLTSDTLSFKLLNTGCDTLYIGNMFSNINEFKLDFVNPLQIAPNDTASVPVVFSTSDSLLHNGIITIVKTGTPNDTAFLYVKGKGIPYPVFELNTTIIDTQLMCDEQVTTQLKITNRGSDTLKYSIPADFYDGFEEGLENWELTGLWGMGIDSYLGTGAISDSPSGDYAFNTNATLTLKEPIYIFDTVNCYFSYHIKYEIEACCDSLETEIKINNDNWIAIDKVSGDADWTLKSFDLSSLVNSGDSLKIRFKLTTDGTVNKNGVSIDEVKIAGTGTGIIGLDHKSGEILPNSHNYLNVTLNAADFNKTQVKTRFRIFSNEPHKNIDTVYCNYVIERYSTLTLLTDSLNFGVNDVLQNDTLPCVFWNMGCDTLFVSSYFSSHAVFTIGNNSAASVAPLDSAVVYVIFNAPDSLTYKGVIGIANSGLNSDTAYVKVWGAGNPFPVLEMNKLLTDSLMFCGERAQTNITLNNIGAEPLEYNIPVNFYDGFEAGLTNWNHDSNWAIDTTSGSGMLTESLLGIYANNLNSSLSLKEPVVIYNPAFCKLSYQLMYDIEACCDTLVTEIKINSSSWITIDTVNGNSDWVDKEFNLAKLLSLGDSLNIRFRFFSDYTESFEGVLLDNVRITGIGNERLTMSKTKGSINPGSAEDIAVTFDSDKLGSRNFQTRFQVFTNNPFKGSDTITCNYAIKNMSSLNLLDSSLQFSNTDVFNTDTLSFSFFNKGCEPLKILDVKASNLVFIIDSTFTKIVAPSDTCIIKVVFSPIDSVNYTGQISLAHSGDNSDTVLISVAGSGNAFPVLKLSRTTVDTLQVCDTDLKFDITLSNIGGGLLEYYIPVNFYDGFENGLDNWEYNGNWGIVYESFDGSAALTESPDGDYQINENAIIVLKEAISIGDAANCKLSFNLYHEMEECCDYLITEVQVNDGSWIKLNQVNNRVDWHVKTYNLSSYVADNDMIKVRFRFTSDLLNHFDGALIDNVTITGANSSRMDVSKNRGKIEAGQSETLVFTNTFPFYTSLSTHETYVVRTNNPFKNSDSVHFSIQNFCEGIDMFFGGGRSGAVSFVINSVAYVALGENETEVFNDLWKFEKSTNKWTPLVDFPGNPRSDAVAFVLNNKAYVGLGYNSVSQQNYNDFYCYDPNKNTWTQVADFTGEARSNAVVFTIAGKGYVGTGIQYNAVEADTQFVDFWVYQPELNRWDTIASPNAVARDGAKGFEIYGKGYFSGGSNKYSGLLGDMHEYNPETGKWLTEIRGRFINLEIKNAGIIAEGNKVYILYGNSKGALTYHPQANRLNTLGDILNLNNSREKPITFILNDTAYFGLGKYPKNTNHSSDFMYPYTLLKAPLVFTHSPTDIALSSQHVKEKNDGNVVVGRINTTDKTKDDSFTYEVVEGKNDFCVEGNKLIATNLDYEAKKNALVKLKSIDKDLNYFEKVFCINILDVNEPPYKIELSGDSVLLNSETGTFVGRFFAYDQDTLSSHIFEFNYGSGPVDSWHYSIQGDSLLVKTAIKADDMVHKFYVEATDNTGLSLISEFFIEVIQGVGIRVSEQVEACFSVYPNPTKNYIIIESLKSNITLVELLLVNVSGNTVKKQQVIGKGTYTLEIGNNEPGIYMLIINTNEGRFMKKVVVE